MAVILPRDANAVAAARESILGEPPAPDAALLETLGVDIEQVRAAVRQTFGTEAVEQLGRRRVHQPWQPWRRLSRRCMSLLAGTRAVCPRVKRAFEHAQRDADRRRRATIDPAALLFGMVEVEDALSNRLLENVGVDPSRIRQALLDRAG